MPANEWSPETPWTVVIISEEWLEVLRAAPELECAFVNGGLWAETTAGLVRSCDLPRVQIDGLEKWFETGAAAVANISRLRRQLKRHLTGKQKRQPLHLGQMHFSSRPLPVTVLV